MSAPLLMWFRRDLRLTDHPALSAAVATGAPVIPVFIRDPQVDGLGAAPKWRLGEGLRTFAASLDAKGSKLIFRSGPAQSVLDDLIAETGASRVFWSRCYDPQSVERDSAIKANLKAQGIEVKSFGRHLLFEPWSVQTKTGGYYKVYTPFWRAQKDREVDRPLPEPAQLAAPATWPKSETLTGWALGADMHRGAAVVAEFAQTGEAAALNRLDLFIDRIVAGYVETRDLPAVDGTSCLSENLALGEISPHMCWHMGRRAMHEGKPGAEVFLKELVWREFAYHLMHHSPQILSENWKPGWDAFPWNTDEDHPNVLAWKQGRTGIPFVDAAMRELYVTGRMHNRGRMIVASYLTKHLLTHWRIGLKWFEDCLIDWDPASNAMGWQWAAGSGPDAAPYFRVFNPVTQREKFDPQRLYMDRWIADGKRTPHGDALKFFEAIPKSWALSPQSAYPAPVVDAAEGRKIALSAYEKRGF